MNETKMHYWLSGIILLSLLWKGLYFYHMAYVVGVILVATLLGYVIKYKGLYIEKSFNHLLLLIGVGLYFVTILYAVDSGMAFMGALKISILYLFYLLISQKEALTGKKYYKDTVVIGSVFMAILGVLAFFIPSLGEYLIQQNRLGSLFQYPNTYGVLMIIAIIFVIAKEKINLGYWIGLVFMWMGLFLTFSRSVFIIGIGAMVVCLIYERKKPHRILWPLLLGMLLGYLVMELSQIGHMIERIETTSPSASEWLTRLLYYQDSIKIMKDYPLGTGHLGFFYLQRIYQTGATYYVKYVHSQLIQIMLDIGVIGALLLGLYFLNNILSKRLTVYEKLSLFILFGHGAMDFDWEFIGLLMVLVIIVGIDREKIHRYNLSLRWGYSLGIILMVAYVYMGLSALCEYIGEEEWARKLYPYYTEAQATLARAYLDSKPERAYELATIIIDHNPYHLTGYRVIRDVAYSEGRLGEALEAAKKVVDLNPLSMIQLEIYSDMLIASIEEDLAGDRIEEAHHKIRDLLEIPYYLDRLAKERLSPYNVKHKPKLSMTDKLLSNSQKAEVLLDKLMVDTRD